MDWMSVTLENEDGRSSLHRSVLARASSSYVSALMVQVL